MSEESSTNESIDSFYFNQVSGIVTCQRGQLWVFEEVVEEKQPMRVRLRASAEGQLKASSGEERTPNSHNGWKGLRECEGDDCATDFPTSF